MTTITTWRPKKRSVRYTEKPEWVPDWIYTEAMTAKRFYNENWEYWVWLTSQDHNVSQAEAEDACIRGINTALLQIQVAYSQIFGDAEGSKISNWFRQYLEMDELFKQVKHNEHNAQLGYTNG